MNQLDLIPSTSTKTDLTYGAVIVCLCHGGAEGVVEGGGRRNGLLAQVELQTFSRFKIIL